MDLKTNKKGCVRLDLKETDQKIELIINQPDRMEDEGEIDLVSVFSNMGRKKRIFLPLLAMFLILGLIIPMLIAELSNRNPDAQAVVQLTYEDAQTVSFPSLVLQEALDETVLSQTITISELESNILIEQLLSEETRQKLEVLEQEIEADKSSVGDAGEITLDYEDKLCEKDCIIEELTNQLAHAKALLDHDGTNTNTPTSQTPPGKKKRIPNTRTKTGRSKG